MKPPRPQIQIRPRKPGPKIRIRPTNVGAAQFLEFMRSKNWSQRDVARLLGLTLNRIHLILQDRSELRVSEAFKIQEFTDGEVAAKSWTMKLALQEVDPS